MLKRLGKALIPLVIALVVLVSVVIGSAFSYVGHQASQDLTGQILIVYLVQVGLGAFMGVFCIFLGAAMCWFGVADAVNVTGEWNGNKLSVQSTRIGIVLLVGGILLTALALHKTAEGSTVTNQIKSNNTLAIEADTKAKEADTKAKEAEKKIAEVEKKVTEKESDKEPDKKKTEIRASEIKIAELLNQVNANHTEYVKAIGTTQKQFYDLCDQQLTATHKVSTTAIRNRADIDALQEKADTLSKENLKLKLQMTELQTQVQALQTQLKKP
jgi:hypothetical protein